jgi:hypothetical protein
VSSRCFKLMSSASPGRGKPVSYGLALVPLAFPTGPQAGDLDPHFSLQIAPSTFILCGMAIFAINSHGREGLATYSLFPLLVSPLTPHFVKFPGSTANSIAVRLGSA